MTGNGLAALATALTKASFYPYRSGVDYGSGRPIEWAYLHEQERASMLADAAAILGEHGAFLPDYNVAAALDGHDGPTKAEHNHALRLAADEIATLRAALDGLVEAAQMAVPALAYGAPVQAAAGLGDPEPAFRAALATAKEAGE